MPAKPQTTKRQHFVPQFYLRNFVIKAGKDVISAYDHRADRFITEVPIKSQAFQYYLYGKDTGVEEDLGKFERAVAKTLATAIPKIIPPITAEGYQLIVEFFLVQHFRTVKAGAQMLEAINAGFEAIRPFMREEDIFPPGLRIGAENPTLIAFVHALEHLPLMNHLALKTIVNLTETPFITSDSPVVLYNQWMEGQGIYTGATGLASMGLQMFLPVCSRLAYCLYDPYIYDLGQPNVGLAEIESADIAQQFNILQYLFSDTQLFFNPETSQESIRKLVEQNKSKREQARPVNGVIFTESPAGKKKGLLLNSFEDPRIGLTLPFFSLTAKGKETKIKDGLPIPRHPDFEKLWEKRKRESERERDQGDQ